MTQAGGSRACLRVWILSRRKEGSQGRPVVLTARDPSQLPSSPVDTYLCEATSGRLSVTPGLSLPKWGLSQQF